LTQVAALTPFARDDIVESEGAFTMTSGAFKGGTHPTPRRHCSLVSLQMKQSGMKQSEPGRKNQMPLGAPEKASGASSRQMVRSTLERTLA